MPTRKSQLRQLAYDARNQQQNPENLSQRNCEQFIALPAYQQADTVMWYISCRSEVKTQSFIVRELNTSKIIVVPYCVQGNDGQNTLGLWWLQDFDELVQGKWGIPEPPKQRWLEPGREINPKQLDCILVPGVAFDRQGGRLGNGGGYYDRLLADVRDDAMLAAACYESQLFEQIAVEPHDVYMDCVITESALYTGIGRKAALRWI
ncbi:MAG: 5-formyltetrahydrofolate cyclo-ligase [Methylococcaceae bacterium]|nr:5-formyltetrahydrofolate cyclo-ligase [Methylococcaceae bacterium]